MGMRPIAIDGGEAKKKLCMEMGAEAFVDFTQVKDVPAEVVRIADGIGAHGVLVTAYQAYKGTVFLREGCSY
jgi:alcohol dehydrogenase, propanol-preferring